jgi:hypothetical protein
VTQTESSSVVSFGPSGANGRRVLAPAMANGMAPADFDSKQATGRSVGVST